MLDVILENNAAGCTMDNTLDTIDTLKNIPLFFEFKPGQLEQIAQISDLIEIDPGDIPIHEGAKLDFVYILLEGEIKVEVFVPTFGQVETSRLGPFDILGWSAMTPIVRQRTGTTTALTHCRLLRIDGKMLYQLCEEDHDIGFIVYRRLAIVAARSFLTTRIQLMNLLAKSGN